MKKVKLTLTLLLMIVHYAFGAIIAIENKFLKITVDDLTGRFVLYKITEHKGDKKYEKILFHKFPFNSYTSIFVDGWVYVFGSDLGLLTIKEEKGKLVTEWKLDNFTVYQDIFFEVNKSSKEQDRVAIQYRVKNIGGETINVGVRILLDLLLGKDSAPTIGTDDKSAITSENSFAGSTVPNYWFSVDKENNVKIQGMLLDGANKPDKVVFSSSERLYANPWHYSYQEGREFKRFFLGAKDSGTAIYYSPREVSPGKSEVFGTTLGLYTGLGETVAVSEKNVQENKVQVVKKIDTEIQVGQEYDSAKKKQILEEYLVKAKNAFQAKDFQGSVGNIEYVLSLDPAHIEGKELWEKGLVELVDFRRKEGVALATVSRNLYKDGKTAFDSGDFTKAGELFNQFMEKEGSDINTDYYKKIIVEKRRLELLKTMDPKDANFPTYTKLKDAVKDSFKNQQFAIAAKYTLNMLEFSPYDTLGISYLKTIRTKITPEIDQQLIENIVAKAKGARESGNLETAHGYYKILAQVFPEFKATAVQALVEKTDVFSSASIPDEKKEAAKRDYDSGVSLFETEKQYTAGIEMIKKSLELNPHDGEVRLKLNLYQVRLKYIVAVDATELLTKIKGDSLRMIEANTHIMKGNALYETGRKEEAKAEYNVALSIAPNHSEAKDNLKKLSD